MLIVRLGALGDLVHAVPAVAALGRAHPDARFDWLVDARYAPFLEYVPGLSRVVVVGTPRQRLPAGAGGTEWRATRGIADAIRTLRARHYDVAVDLQGLLKSAGWARASGARRVVGFAAAHARERAAALLYSERVVPPSCTHVIDKNLAVASALGAEASSRALDLRVPASPVADEIRASAGGASAPRYAILNPGAGWPNKCWGADRFAAVARHLRERHGLTSVIVWGPGERDLAGRVVDASDGAARLAPATGIGDLLAVARDAALFVAGDTGPLQLAAAVGTPIVGLFGPTNPARNGPWSPEDLSVSEFERCRCHHKRRCRRETPCIADITVPAVVAAIDRRLAKEGFGG